jgi:signal transduction histidine kinase
VDHATRPGWAIAAAALQLVGDGVDATELTSRFAAAGARIDDGVAASSLRDLADLGLVRVARASASSPRYVLTTLGTGAVAAAPGGATTESLADLERLRTDLLSTIAHELRTPLTAVRTSAGLLLDESTRATEAQRRTLLDTIERNAERMQRIVGDILDLARFRSGAIRLQLRRFDATGLAREVIATIRPLAEERGQIVTLEPDGRADGGTGPPVFGEGGPAVFGDHRRLEQALLNLVSNAHRFAPEGGHVTLRVDAGDDGFVRWSVTDDGPGIPAEDRARLFERFFVGRSDRNAAREGVGLGLPTALAIAQAHGGRIDVESEPGRGSTFSLVVPELGPPEAP